VVGDVIDNFSDAVGDFIGELFGGKNLDGEIITGSPNVKIKGKKAARAAGKPPLEQLAAENYAQAQDDSEPENPYLNKAKEIADRILKVYLNKAEEIAERMLKVVSFRQRKLRSAC